MSEVGRGLWMSSHPTPLVKQGHLQQDAQSDVQMAFKYLQEGHSASSLGKLCQGLVTLTGEKCFLVFRIWGYETSPLPQLNSSITDFQPKTIRELSQFFLSGSLYSPFTCAVIQCCRRLLCYRRSAPLSLLEGVVFLAWCCHVPIPLGWIMFCTLSVGEKHGDAPCSKQELFLKA